MNFVPAVEELVTLHQEVHPNDFNYDDEMYDGCMVCIEEALIDG